MQPVKLKYLHDRFLLFTEVQLFILFEKSNHQNKNLRAILFATILDLVFLSRNVSI